MDGANKDPDERTLEFVFPNGEVIIIVIKSKSGH